MVRTVCWDALGSNINSSSKEIWPQLQKFQMAILISSSFYDQKKTRLQDFLIVESSKYIFLYMSMISYLTPKSTVAFFTNLELLTIINLQVISSTNILQEKFMQLALNTISGNFTNMKRKFFKFPLSMAHPKLATFCFLVSKINLNYSTLFLP